jgi:hypothetical protein
MSCKIDIILIDSTVKVTVIVLAFTFGGKGWENEDLTLILRKKMEIFADTSAFNAGVK